MALKKTSKEEVAVTEEVVVEEANTREVASVDRLNTAIDLMCSKFGLDEEYVLTAFQDKGNSVKITMNNKDFEVACTIKNPELYGFESAV